MLNGEFAIWYYFATGDDRCIGDADSTNEVRKRLGI